MDKEIIELFAVKNKLLDDLALIDVNPFLEGMVTYLEDSHKDLMEQLRNLKAFNDTLSAAFIAAIKDYKAGYKPRKD